MNFPGSIPLLQGPSWVVLLAILAVAGSGCGGDSPTSPASPVVIGASQDLTGEALVATSAAIQDEYRAEAVYARVLEEFGADAMPFAQIVNAEVRHSDSLADLFLKRGLQPPASEWSPESAPSFVSLFEACAAGIAAEQANIALYDGSLSLDLPLDVRTVFANNREASLERHLPAFESCVRAWGGPA